MRKTKKQGVRFLPFSKYRKAKKDAQTYKNLYREEFVEGALAKRRESIAKADSIFANSLLEWLTLYPLQAKSMEELEEWKEKFKDFQRKQLSTYDEKRKSLREVQLLVDGKNRTYRING